MANTFISTIKNSLPYKAFSNLFSANTKTDTNTTQLAANNTAGNAKKPIVASVNRQKMYAINVSLEERKKAIQMAENVSNPDRRLLYELYNRVMDDEQLTTTTNTRIKRVLKQKWVVAIDSRKPLSGRFSDEHKKLLEGAWFRDTMRYAMESIMWGHSLVEIMPLENGEIKNVSLVWREHVSPERGEIMLNASSYTGTFPYRDGNYAVFEFGDKYDLGLLKKASKLVIAKWNALSDWGMFSEDFGQPLVAAKLVERDDKELDAMESALSGLGKRRYLMLDADDDVSFIDATSKGDSVGVFEKRSTREDEGIAKLILGQTLTTDAKSGSGYAQSVVHQDILDDYTIDDLSWLQYQVNDIVFPMLIKLGYPLKGTSFKFYRLTEEWEEEKSSSRF